MRWKVILSENAEGDLADIWANSSDRRSVSASADLLDFRLEHSPETNLTSLSEELWTLDIPPLRFYVEFDHPQQAVIVTAVARLKD